MPYHTIPYHTIPYHTIYVPKYTSFSHWRPFLFRPRVFPRPLGCVAPRGGAYTLRCKFGARPGTVALALGVQSHASWQVIAGSFSAEPEPTRPMEAPQHVILFCFALCCCCCFWSTTEAFKAWQPRYNSRPSSFSSVTATNGVSACLCVSMRVCHPTILL